MRPPRINRASRAATPANRRLKSQPTRIGRAAFKQRTLLSTKSFAEESSTPKGQSAQASLPEAGPQHVGQEQATQREQLPPLPEASLASLLAMLSNQAMVALGLIRNPVTGKAKKELPLARYFIDLIDILEQKTKGNLDPDEAAALDETLYTLRMAYVHRSKETA